MAPRKSGLTRATSKKINKRKRNTEALADVGEGSNARAEGESTPPEPPKKKGRGPGKIRKSTDIAEDRPIIWPIGNREFTCEQNPREITAAITRLALNHMPAPLRSFHAFDDATKNNIEFAFLEKFRYREGEDPGRCRDVLEAIAAKRYSEELHEARDNCIKKFGNDLQAWKASIPHWCLDHPNWHGLCDIFATEEWQSVSRQNHDNRTTSGLVVSHFGGSASAHQHFGKLDCLFLPFHVEKTLNKGKVPTMGDLYLHIHCRRENDKSPVVAQMESAMMGVSGHNENSDGNGLMDPSTEETSTQVQAFDINSLQFTNKKAQAVYQQVKDMRSNQANDDMDESTMFLSAVGGSRHGRVRGFGSMLDDKVQTPTTRARPTHTTSSVSGVTNNGVQRSFTYEEVQTLLADRDRRQDEDRAERKREQETYDFYFSQLFTMFGAQKPTLQAQGNNSGTEQGVIGNQLNFQGQGPTSQPSQGVAFQAIINQAQAGNDEIARSEAAMNQWCRQSTFNVNQPF